MFITACGVVATTPTPTPMRPTFEVLVDIGMFGGPPDLPPPYALTGFTEDTLLLVDRGAVQQLREVCWAGAGWESIGGTDQRLIPAGEDGPYLRAVSVGPDDGFSKEAVLLVGRVPNGPINRFEMEIDGAAGEVWVEHRPAFLHVFPPGTALGADFTAYDIGTFQLDSGPIHHD